MLGDRALVDSVLSNYKTAPISETDKAIFELVHKVNEDAADMTQANIDTAKAAGLEDNAIFDAITICGMFRFFNTWTDAMGVREMPASAFVNSGERLAKFGYAPPA